MIQSTESHQTTQVFEGNGTIRLLSIGGDAIALDVGKNERGETVITLGSPFCTSVVVAARAGRRKLIVRAVETTKVMMT